MGKGDGDQSGHRASRLLGSLKDALAAASRDDTAVKQRAKAEQEPAAAAPVTVRAEAAEPAGSVSASEATQLVRKDKNSPSAAEAARELRSEATVRVVQDRHVEFEAPPTTRVVRMPKEAKETKETDDTARTQVVRGRQSVKRGKFHQDPVVAWLVIVGGPGLGAYRPIYEGNNTIGRGAGQRIPIDFGDDAISSEEQAFIRYDSSERSFLFVPNLAKTNIVSVNDKRPTGAVELAAMDLITMGRTQLVFVPFCGPEFDWSEISETKD